MTGPRGFPHVGHVSAVVVSVVVMTFYANALCVPRQEIVDVSYHPSQDPGQQPPQRIPDSIR